MVPARGGAASGKPRLALAGRPWPLLAKVAQRFFPATEVLFSPTGGLSSPRAVLEAVTTETFPFLWAGKQTQTGARTQLGRRSRWRRPGLCGRVPSVAKQPVRRVSTLGTCVRGTVGEGKCDPWLRVPSGGGRKAWRPRGEAVAGFSRYGGGRPLALAALGGSRAKTSQENVCFPVRGETAVLKWYVALGEACCFPALSPREELRYRVCA